MKYRLAVFDCDGTILDTLSDLAAAGNHALTAAGFPTHSHKDYRAFVGNGIRKLVERALPPGHRDEATAERVRVLFSDYYNAHSTDRTAPYPGIPGMLGALREAGMRIGVSTNKPDDAAQALIPAMLPGLIDFVVGQREGIPVKPDPAGVRLVMEHFGMGPQQCVFIGDSDVDILTGKAASLFTVGVTWGFRTKDVLIKAGADVIVDKVEDLTKILIDK